jgi:hypothetical protein
MIAIVIIYGADSMSKFETTLTSAEHHNPTDKERGMNDNPNENNDLDIIYGIGAIASVMRMPERKAYHLASKGLLPGCFKLGRSWAMDRKVARDSMKAFAKAGIAAPKAG